MEVENEKEAEVSICKGAVCIWETVILSPDFHITIISLLRVQGNAKGCNLFKILFVYVFDIPCAVMHFFSNFFNCLKCKVSASENSLSYIINAVYSCIDF